MTTQAQDYSLLNNGGVNTAPLTFGAILDALFAVQWREDMDAAVGGDKSDGAFMFGL